MNRYPSRAEKRQDALYRLAERGFLSMLNAVLYPAEVKKLIKEGFQIKNVRQFESSKSLVTADISWENAFGYAVPEIAHAYVTGQNNKFPPLARTFPQKLWVIASRVRYAKHQ